MVKRYIEDMPTAVTDARRVIAMATMRAVDAGEDDVTLTLSVKQAAAAARALDFIARSEAALADTMRSAADLVS